TGIDAGSYLVMVTDANGCTAAQDVAVTAPDRNDWTMTGNAGTNPSNQFIGTTDNKDLVFKTNNSERLRVNANGGVKINSLSGNGTQLLLVDDNGLLLKQNPNIPIGLSTIWMTNGNLTTANHYIGTNNTQPLIFKTDVNASATLGEKMRIMPDGKVGIGTNNPDVLFHIMGNKLLNPSQQPVALMKIESESPNTCGLVFENIPAMGSAKQGAKFQLTGDGVFSIWNTSSTGSLGGGKPCIAIKDGTTVAGKVFIGGLPSEILNPQTGSINYRLYVMGGIAAREVKVTVNAFPDYVFESDYKVMPLTKLDKYIKQYKHLPDVPSAKEVDDNNGIEVGKMQTLLLKKVEELTLYIIAQQKELDEVKAQLLILKK
ncbi:MAG: hypothetical protein JNK61_13075, partial [Bacteroidia bacterium]|nr:hypothetical protein [Bacteroidia bacterium]